MYCPQLPFQGPATRRRLGVEVLELDITDDGQVEAAAAQARDVTLLVNNAGVATRADLIAGDIASIRHEVETNLFGALRLTRAFAPVLGRNGGGAVLNVLSAASWLSAPGAGAYAMSKAAAWSLTDATRLGLAPQGTQVLGLHMAMVDTDMTAALDVPKSAPRSVVAQALDGLEAGATEVIADEATLHPKGTLGQSPAERYAS